MKREDFCRINGDLESLDHDIRCAMYTSKQIFYKELL